MEKLEENKWRKKKYAFFAIDRVRRKLDPPVRWKGRNLHQYQAPQLIVRKRKTGELFQVAGYYFAERFLKRETILNGMRPRPRHFACFVLQFRNFRRGTTPELGQLVRWYADLYEMRPDNVRRYIGALEKAGVIESETLMGPLFQFSAADMRPGEFLGEESAAGSKFTLMWARRERLRQERAEFVGDAEPLLETLRRGLAKPAGESFHSRVVVPLEHLERLVPCNGREFDDVRQLDGQPCCSGMAEVMKPHVFYASPSARPFEAFV